MDSCSSDRAVLREPEAAVRDRGAMKCIACDGDSRILTVEGRERLRECVGCRRRWRSVELLQRHTLTDLPATADSVKQLRSTGKNIREIAEALHMSTATVQQHLSAVPDLVGAWK